MTVTWRTPTWDNSNTGVEPTGTVQNDLVVAFAVGVTALPALPVGWSSITTDSGISSRFVRVAAIIRGATAPSYTFTSATRIIVYTFPATSFRQLPTVANVIAAVRDQTVNTTSITWPAFTNAPGAGDAVVCLATSTASLNWSTLTPSAGFTLSAANQGTTDIVGGQQGNGSSTGNGPYVVSTGNTQAIAVSLDVTDPTPAVHGSPALMLTGVG